MNIVNVSTAAPEWNWLAYRFADRPDLRWTHVSTEAMPVPRWLPRGDLARRVLAARAARRLASPDDSMLVSHGPRISLYVELANRRRPRRAHHLAYVFNYTELPHGKKRALHAHALATVDRFVVFSTTEREIYARYFDLPIDRIDMIHWAVRPPAIGVDEPALIAGDYLCAVGGQGRDYGVLVEAMRKLPSLRLVIVSTRAAMAGLDVPGNVEVRLDTPLAEATNLIAHSRFMALPLRDAEVPCGHVTIVSAMHLGKAIVATGSSGIADYIQEGVNGRLAAPHDPASLAAAIESLAGDDTECRRLGENGRAFARAHCMEDNAVAYFRGYLAGRSHAAASG
jgi:glycosyltransferase involved in cell wall biosynthesis